MFVATLIAAHKLSEDMVAHARRILDVGGHEPQDPRWIDPGDAAIIPCALDPDGARARLMGYAPGVDIVVQPAATPRRLLIADMDSTMITVECIDELADYAGIKPKIADITERAMRGELDFDAALSARVALLQGLPETVLATCLAERVSLTPGARVLVRTMRAKGADTVLVSGGFTHFADPVGLDIGFAKVIANRLEIADGKLTGRVIPPIVNAATKESALGAAVAAAPYGVSETMAVGDGANDLPMLRAAGLGIAYHAKPAVRQQADACIDSGDLTALLWAQGIPRAEWVAD